MSEHRWSGWPGAWCLDCGVEDAAEMCRAGHHRPKEYQVSTPPDFELTDHVCKNDPCSQPNSGAHDPYRGRPA